MNTAAGQEADVDMWLKTGSYLDKQHHTSSAEESSGFLLSFLVYLPTIGFHCVEFVTSVKLENGFVD